MALSPMMVQYQKVKDKYKDCILFYRLGDFYEMFFDDALVASKALGLTLTGRDCGLTERAPMCGVPHHAVNTYIADLVSQGYKIAICEQLTAPSAKGIVERGVVRVVTPGTKIDLDMLEEKENNYIAAVSSINGIYGVCWADMSTGEVNVATTTSKGDLTELSELLLKINPKEIISNSETAKLQMLEVERNALPKFQPYSDWVFSVDNATKTIKTQFEVNSIEQYGINGNKPAISACGAIFEYLKDTQKRVLNHFEKINFIEEKAFMKIDSNTRRNLELLYSNRDGKRYGTLYGLLNKTKTPMGARLLNKYIEQPLIEERRINNRLYAVKDLTENYFNRDSLVESLSKIRDIERLVSKVAYRNATPIDLLAIKNSIEVFPEIKEVLQQFNSPLLIRINESIDTLIELHTYLDNALLPTCNSQVKDGGFIREGFSTELDELKNIMTNGKSLLSQMEEEEREKSGIKSLKIGYNRVFGYYIEILRSNQMEVPLHYVRKQTISNAERYITDELKTLENKILNATDNAIKIEGELFKELVERVATNIKELLSTASAIANLDVLVSFSVVSESNNYTLPIISSDENAIDIEEGRHPVVEQLLKQDRFVGNDTLINSTNERTMILTGPNMAGKSTYMRQVALISIMAQMGCFVPAKSCRLPIFDRVFTRVGASDNLLFDQSTFMVEMIEVSNILNNATKDSLIILDEVGRGTSTLDGLAIAFAVTKHITSKIKAKTLFATHYHELTELEGTLEGISNYRISVKEQDNKIVFLHKIVRGGANRSFGIEVASLAGLPKAVIKDAKKTLRELENSDIITTKKQLSFEDMMFQTEEENPYQEVIDEIKQLDMDDISFKEAHNILTKIKEEIN